MGSTKRVIRWALLVASLGILAARSPAWGVPAPMSPEQLESASDLVATVRVLGVVCADAEARDGERLGRYQAWLRIVDLTKGSVRAGESVLVQWSDVPRRLVGAWTVAYYPGEELLTHLKWDAAQHVYVTTWWNAKGRPRRAPDTRELPKDCGGPGRES